MPDLSEVSRGDSDLRRHQVTPQYDDTTVGEGISALAAVREAPIKLDCTHRLNEAAPQCYPCAAKWSATQVLTRVSGAKPPPKCSFRQQHRITTHAGQRWTLASVGRPINLRLHDKSSILKLGLLPRAVSAAFLPTRNG